jgi:osmoprotectant transport system ATP-binding protein
MDILNVKDLMTPLDTKYLLDASMDIRGAVQTMKETATVTGIVFENNVLVGKVEMIDLLKSEDEYALLRNVAKPMKVFAPQDSVASALSEMKKSGEYMAMVMNGNAPGGVLVSDEVLLKLI